LTDQKILAQIATSPAPYVTLEDRYLAVSNITEVAPLADVAIGTTNYYVRFLATKKLSDEELNQTDKDKEEIDDYAKARAIPSLESFVSFIKRHPSGLHVERALAGMWRLLLTEYPPKKYVWTTTYRNHVRPVHGGDCLYWRIIHRMPCAIAFRRGDTYYFQELAGHSITIDTVQPGLPNNSQLTEYGISELAKVQPRVNIGPFGTGTYE